MVDTAEPPTEIVFQGVNRGSEIMGALQGNFLVPDIEREFAILVNVPTLDWLIQELGLEDTEENREELVSQIGGIVVRLKLESRRIDPLTFVGKHFLDEYPSVLEDLKSTFYAK